MDNSKKISISMVVFGMLLVIYGVYRMYATPDVSAIIGPQDQTGMYILSIGAVLAIFGTGSMVDKKS